jgi:hypothetical protein
MIFLKKTWPYPSEFELESKLQTNENWNYFKNKTIKDIYDYKKKCEYFNLFS